MNGNIFFKRSVFLIAALVVCLVIFAGRLFFLQVVNGDEYLAQSEQKLTRSVTVKAPRGEILDRYGRPLVTNRSSFAVKIDGDMWKLDDSNKLLIDLATLCEQNGAAFIDSLPITKNAPFSYAYQAEEDSQSKDTFLKYIAENDWPEDATASAVVNLICDEYDVSGDYTDAERRILAGIYYEMEQRNFGSKGTFVFADDVDVALVTKIKERSRELPCIMIDVDSVREYQTPYAAHILGRVGQIYREEYDDILSLIS